MSVRLRDRTLTATVASWLYYEGPGQIEALKVDVTGSGDERVKIYDGRSTSGVLVWDSAAAVADLGTTVPARVFTNASIVAGTDTADAHLGIPFGDALFVDVTGLTGVETCLVTILLRPLKAVASTSTLDGPGLLYGIKAYAGAAGTIVLKDNAISNTGNQLFTKALTASTVVPVATTSNVADDADTTVTTAATGAYSNNGIAFFTGLNATGVTAGRVDLLFEQSGKL